MGWLVGLGFFGVVFLFVCLFHCVLLGGLLLFDSGGGVVVCVASFYLLYMKTLILPNTSDCIHCALDTMN